MNLLNYAKVFGKLPKNNIDNIVIPLGKMPKMGVLIDVSSFSNNEITSKWKVQLLNQLKM